MRRRQIAAGLVVLAAVAWYAVRAVGAVSRAPAHGQGRRAFAAGRYEEAARALSRAVGDGRQAAELWYAGQSTLAVYRARLVAEAPAADLDALLATAYRQFTEAITRSPASGWYWAALAEVYHERERRDRAREGVPLEVFAGAPLGALGRSGAVALGALRLAIAREPTLYAFYDQIALVYFDYHLDDRALAAVRDAARVQPLFDQHTIAALDPQPPGLLDAFAEGARAALGHTPLLRAVDHHIALGRLELGRGRYADALGQFDLALASPRPALQDAEARYHRARALELLGRIEEARADLASAAGNPVFTRAATRSLARIEEQAGRLEAALAHLYAVRRLDPQDLATLLDLSRVAAALGRSDEARQALSWAATRHPSSPQPIVRLAELALAGGDLPAAQVALERLADLAPGDPEVARLRRDLAEARQR